MLAMFADTVKNPGISLVAASETEEAQTSPFGDWGCRVVTS